MIPTLSEEYQQAHTHAHDHERFPEREAQLKPVEPTCHSHSELIVDFGGYKDERRQERNQRPIPSHPGSECEEPVAARGDDSQHKEADILRKIAQWQIERAGLIVIRPPE